MRRSRVSVRPCRGFPAKHTSPLARNAPYTRKPPHESPMHVLRASGAKHMAPAEPLKWRIGTRPSRQRVEVQRKIESARARVSPPVIRPRARPTTDSSEASSPAIFGVLPADSVRLASECHRNSPRDKMRKNPHENEAYSEGTEYPPCLGDKSENHEND